MEDPSNKRWANSLPWNS